MFRYNPHTRALELRELIHKATWQFFETYHQTPNAILLSPRDAIFLRDEIFLRELITARYDYNAPGFNLQYDGMIVLCTVNIQSPTVALVGAPLVIPQR